MSSNQIKGDLKLATLQKSLVKAVARALIFAEVQKKSLKYKQLHKWLQMLLELWENYRTIFRLKDLN